MIRDLAATGISHVHTRRDHPSYGVTKTALRRDLDVMNGAIGLYMVLDGQATHASVPQLAQFRENETTARVKTARERLDGELS